MASDLGVMSPELVLVDSELAARARALLPDVFKAPVDPALPIVSALPIVPDTPAPPTPQSRGKPSVFPVSFPDNGSFVEGRRASDTLLHLAEKTPVCEEPESPLSSRTHFRRPTTFIPTSSAALAASLLALQVYVSAGSL